MWYFIPSRELAMMNQWKEWSFEYNNNAWTGSVNFLVNIPQAIECCSEKEKWCDKMLTERESCQSYNTMNIVANETMTAITWDCAKTVVVNEI